MIARYSGIMRNRQPLPDIWLISDRRNDAMLENALARLPRGSGFIYRHYHLADQPRAARFRQLARLARANGHVVILADRAQLARQWGADGIYGTHHLPRAQCRDLLRLATAHDLREVGQANRLRADAILISPIFPTKSHPGGKSLGKSRFRTLASHAQMPAIALGGMTAKRAESLNWRRWAAIDGLS